MILGRRLRPSGKNAALGKLSKSQFYYRRSPLPMFRSGKTEKLMPKYSRSLLARAQKVKLLLMDVDGVLTDGKFYYVSRQGGGLLETKGFDSRDGLGLRLAHHSGLMTGVITGRSSTVIEYRVKDLGIQFLQQNALEKIEPYLKICKAAQVVDEEVCYVGDDLTDLPLITRVGLGVCVANADEILHEYAHFCTQKVGGSGAVREAIQLILTAQGKWQAIVDSYLHGTRAINLSPTETAGKS
jgi:3-deoxy-D-manno-octulosonate 8-phosphate phosphatase (KDO 8-P phosphatase)